MTKKRVIPSPVPFERTWWIVPGLVLGGPYPGNREPAVRTARLRALFSSGVRQVICLQEPEERGYGGRTFPDYQPEWQAIGRAAGIPVRWHRMPIVDMGVPSKATMSRILQTIHGSITPTYVHCWGGHGRTGTVAGCLLVERGLTGQEALAVITQARASDAYLAERESPQTPAQVRFVLDWRSDDNT